MRRCEQENLFEDWLGQHGAIPAKIARAYAATPADQDDLLQEILLQLWMSIRSFRGDCKASTWIYRVALNTAFAWKRGERKRVRNVACQAITETTAAGEAAANEAERNERVERLYAEIRKLPDVSRSLVLLHLDGASYQEMASVLGISVSNVGVKLNRIKQQLATALKGSDDAN